MMGTFYHNLTAAIMGPMMGSGGGKFIFLASLKVEDGKWL